MIEHDHALAQHIERLVEEKVQARLADIERRLAQAEKPRRVTADRATIVVFNGDLDRAMAAFIIGTGAAAMGMDVSMFFTFWGIPLLKKKTVLKGKSSLEKAFSLMLPGSAASAGLSKMNMLGLGPKFMKRIMKEKNVETLPHLIEVARELNVKLVACQMSMGIMGISRDELLDGVEYGGVASYLGEAADSRITLFI